MGTLALPVHTHFSGNSELTATYAYNDWPGAKKFRSISRIAEKRWFQGIRAGIHFQTCPSALIQFVDFVAQAEDTPATGPDAFQQGAGLTIDAANGSTETSEQVADLPPLLFKNAR